MSSLKESSLKFLDSRYRAGGDFCPSFLCLDTGKGGREKGWRNFVGEKLLSLKQTNKITKLNITQNPPIKSINGDCSYIRGSTTNQRQEESWSPAMTHRVNPPGPHFIPASLLSITGPFSHAFGFKRNKCTGDQTHTGSELTKKKILIITRQIRGDGPERDYRLQFPLCLPPGVLRSLTFCLNSRQRRDTDLQTERHKPSVQQALSTQTRLKNWTPASSSTNAQPDRTSDCTLSRADDTGVLGWISRLSIQWLCR